MTKGASPQLYRLRDILTALLKGAPLTKELGTEASQLSLFLTGGELNKLNSHVKGLTREAIQSTFVKPFKQQQHPGVDVDIDAPVPEGGRTLREELLGLLYVTNAVIKHQEGVLPQAISLAQKEVTKIASPQIKEAWDKAAALKAATGIGRISIARELNEMLTPASQAKIFGADCLLSGEDQRKLKGLRDLAAKLSNPEAGPSDGHALTEEDIQDIINEGIEVLERHHQGQQGFLGKVIEVVNKELVGNVVGKIDEKAHPDLIEARRVLLDLQHRIICPITLSDLASCAENLEKAIQQVIDDRAKIFKKSPLSEQDHAALQKLLNFLPRLKEVPAVSDAEDDEEALDAPLNPADGLPRKEEVLPFLRKAGAVLEQHFQEESGTVPKIADTLTNLPYDLAASGVGAAKMQFGKHVERGPINIKAEPNETEQVSIGSYLTNASSFLSGFLKTGATALSQEVLTSVAGSVLYALDGALESIEGQPHFDGPREKIQELVSKLIPMQKECSVTDLFAALQGDGLDALNSANIYINGFSCPKIGTLGDSLEKPDSIYLSNISNLRKALKKEVEAPEDAATLKAKADIEKREFLNNTKNFLTLKLIYEWFCGLPPPSDSMMYLKLMRGARREGQSMDEEDAAIKKALFVELENAGVNRIGRFFANRVYDFLNSFFNNFVRKVSATYLREAIKLIEEGRKSNFNTLKQTAINNFTRYLTVLGGAYTRIANNNFPDESLPKMRRAELEIPESNCEYSIPDLYAEFAAIIIDKYAENGSVTRMVTGWIIKTILFMNREKLADAILHKTAGSLMDANGYTHALTTVMVEHMKKIRNMIQEKHGSKNTEGPSSHKAAYSSQKKLEIAGLLKNLFEILQKSKCLTQDELKAHLEGKSLTRNIIKTVDDLFIPGLIEEITNVAALATETVIDEKHIDELTYTFAQLVNTVYKEGRSPTIEDMRAKEKEFEELKEEIINASITAAVEDKFNFTAVKEQKETTDHIKELQKKTEEFVESSSKDLISLEELLKHPAAHQDRVEFKTKLDGLLEDALAYENECQTGLGKKRGSPQLNSDNKKKVEERHTHIAKNSEELVLHISAMANAQKEIRAKELLTPHLEAMQGISQEIVDHFAKKGIPTTVDVNWAIHQISRLEGRLEEVKRGYNQTALSNDLKKQISELTTSLIDLRLSVGVIEFCTEQNADSTLIAQIVEEKRTQLGVLVLPSSLRYKIDQLKTRIMVLNHHDLQHKLFVQLNEIESSSIPEKLDTALAEFQRLVTLAQDHATGQIAGQQEKIRQSSKQIHELAGDSPLMEKDYVTARNQIIRESLKGANKGVERIRLSCQAADPRLVDAKEKAQSLYNMLRREDSDAAKLTSKTQELSASIEALLSYHGAQISNSLYLTGEELQTLRKIQELLNRYQEGKDLKKEIIEQLPLVLEILNRHKKEQSLHYAFEAIPYKNITLMDTNGFKSLAVGLVSNRVKEYVNELIQLMRNKDTYLYGLANHMIVIPYVQAHQ